MSQPESKIPQGLIPGKRKRIVVLREPFWEKQRYESEKALLAWSIYRDWEPAERAKRGHKGVSEEMRKRGFQSGIGVIHRWARTWKWQVRLEAYVLQKDREALELSKKDRLETLQRHREIAQTMQNIGIAKLNQRVEELQAQAKAAAENNETPRLDITDRDAAALSKDGIMLERLQMGEATDRVITETPQMVAERRLRIAVTDLQKDIDLRQTNNPDEPKESYDRWLQEIITWAVEDYEVDYTELAGVFMVDTAPAIPDGQPSAAEN